MIGDILGIANKVLGRFNMDRKSLRRGRIEKLEAEQKRLIMLPWSELVARKRERIRVQLAELYKQAKND